MKMLEARVWISLLFREPRPLRPRKENVIAALQKGLGATEKDSG